MAAFAAVSQRNITEDNHGPKVGKVKSQFKRWKRISTVARGPAKQRSVQSDDDEEADDMFLVLVNVSGRKFEVCTIS